MDTAYRFQCIPLSFKLAFREGAAVNIAEINEEILDSVARYGGKAVLAYTRRGRAVTFEELARNGITPDMAGSEAETVKVLTFDFREEKLFVLDRQSAIPLARLRLTAAYRPGGGGGEPPETLPQNVPQKPLDPEDDDYTADVYVKRKNG